MSSLSILVHLVMPPAFPFFIILYPLILRYPQNCLCHTDFKVNLLFIGTAHMYFHQTCYCVWVLYVSTFQIALRGFRVRRIPIFVINWTHETDTNCGICIQCKTPIGSKNL